MLASIFKDLIEKYLPSLAKKITEKVNGKERDLEYEHKKYLKKDFSPDMKFKSLATNTNIVAADIVALDSELPLKKRGSVSSAEGEVPKLGMIKAMSESMLQALKNLIARGNKEAEIAKKLFKDTADCVKGVYERLDIMFLQALSSGTMLVGEDINTGTGIRVNFELNQFGAIVPWSKETAKPIDDIENVLTRARNAGHGLKYLWIDKVTYNAFKANEQVKKAFAGYLKADLNLIFRISKKELEEFLSEEFGLTLIIIDKVVQIEKNGKKVPVEPWERGNVTFTASTDVGTLTYSELAEVDHKVPGVQYELVDDFILVSMFRSNNPLKENTSVQALAIPVLDNTESLYILDTKEAFETSIQTEGDSTIELFKGEETPITVERAAVIKALVALDIEASDADTDKELIEKINRLSDEEEDLLREELGA